MRKALAALAVLAVGLTAAGVAIAAGGQGITATQKIHFAWTIQHTNAFVNGQAPAPGDVSYFAGPIARDGHKAGAFRASCTSVAPERGECVGTLVTADGNIQLAGSVGFDRSTDWFAVTGGTQKYSNVRGDVKSHNRRSGNKIDFFITLLP
ncbi:MAG: hypothetical protein ABR600_08785 [Actinomycetota bacterium]